MKHGKEWCLLCVFGLTALLLLGVLDFVIRSGGGIFPKAARYTLHNDGLTQFSDDETFHYWIDAAKIGLDNCMRSSVSGDLIIENHNGTKAIVLKKRRAYTGYPPGLHGSGRYSVRPAARHMEDPGRPVI